MKLRIQKQMTLLASLLLCSCAGQKTTRLWIDPPTGQGVDTESAIRYEFEDSITGTKESFQVPVRHSPENLVVKGNAKSNSDAEMARVTRADRPFQKNGTSISYLRGSEEVQKLFEDKKYTEALVRLTPLIEEYPEQSKLHLMQGTLYKRIGEKKKALDSFRKASALEKNNIVLQETVERLSLELGEKG